MRRMVCIRFSEPADKARALLEPYGLKVDEKSWIQTVDMAIDDERLEPFREGLRQKGIDFTEVGYNSYDKNDLQSAEFLQMRAEKLWGYPQPEDDYEGASFEDSTRCPRCGQGAKQNRPLLLKGRPGFGRRDIVEMFWTYELLVTPKLRDIIEGTGLSGAEFWPLMKYTRSKTYHAIDGVYQLFVTTDLPPMSTHTRFEMVEFPSGAEKCPCGKLGRNLKGEQIVYSRKALRRARDFNRTHEWLGGGYGTTQQKVVSHKVYNLFSKEKIRGAVFEPVLIEE